MLLVVPGLILLGVAAGIALASYKLRRIRRIVASSGMEVVPAPDDIQETSVAGAAFRLRLVLFVGAGLAGGTLTVVGLVWSG